MDPYYNVVRPLNYIGGYQIGGPLGIQVMLTKKPSWIHRVMMKLCFGIVWVDTV